MCEQAKITQEEWLRLKRQLATIASALGEEMCLPFRSWSPVKSVRDELLQELGLTSNDLLPHRDQSVMEEILQDFVQDISACKESADAVFPHNRQ